MKKLLMSALFCVSSLAFAGDAAKLTHIGFSANGQNYAFMESGVHDGMGNAYARVRFIELASNKYAASSVERIQTEEEMETPGIDLASIEAEVLKKSAETLAKLEISSSVKGDVVISRKLTDLAARKLTDASFSIYPIIGGLGSPTYKVKLTQSAAKAAAGAYCMDEKAAKKIKLELTNNQTKKDSRSSGRHFTSSFSRLCS